MAQNDLVSKLNSVLNGYAIRTIHLEEEVEVSGYTQVMEGLVALSGKHGDPGVDNAAPEFLVALSPKSKGLMLTSALLTDNQALYVPLYNKIDSSLGEIYPQDLTSLLGGEHAPKALEEMTWRACNDMSVLPNYSIGFSQISASRSGSTSLADVRAEICESSWMSKHPQETRDFLTMVDAAPDSEEIKALKQGPLTKFLSAGLKLGTVAVVLASVGLSAIQGLSFAHHASNIGYVDLSTRQSIESVIGKDGVDHLKLVRQGEFDGLGLVGKYIKDMRNKSLSDAAKSFSDSKAHGVAAYIKKGVHSDEALCMVSDHETARVSEDGAFYKFSNYKNMIVEKNLWDFYIKSHETAHCFFWVDTKGPEGMQLDQYEEGYLQSLQEINGDLVAILDYMHETGTNDLYTNFIRPFRISAIESTDLDHRTAWALDELIQQIDIDSIQKKDKEELTQVARYLMEKNFMTKNGDYFPSNMRKEGQGNIDTPAAKALWNEIFATRLLGYERYDNPIVQKLTDDVHATMSSNYAKYDGVAPKEVMDMVKAEYADQVKLHNLKPLDVVPAQKVVLSKPVDSFMERYL